MDNSKESTEGVKAPLLSIPLILAQSWFLVPCWYGGKPEFRTAPRRHGSQMWDMLGTLCHVRTGRARTPDAKQLGPKLPGATLIRPCGFIIWHERYTIQTPGLDSLKARQPDKTTHARYQGHPTQATKESLQGWCWHEKWARDSKAHLTNWIFDFCNVFLCVLGNKVAF